MNLRESHERPEGMEEGAVIMTGVDYDSVLAAIPVATGMKRGQERSIRIVRDYDSPYVSDVVLKTILSYSDFIKRRVWKQY